MELRGIQKSLSFLLLLMVTFSVSVSTASPLSVVTSCAQILLAKVEPSNLKISGERTTFRKKYLRIKEADKALHLHSASVEYIQSTLDRLESMVQEKWKTTDLRAMGYQDSEISLLQETLFKVEGLKADLLNAKLGRPTLSHLNHMVLLYTLIFDYFVEHEAFENHVVYGRFLKQAPNDSNTLSLIYSSPEKIQNWLKDPTSVTQFVFNSRSAMYDPFDGLKGFAFVPTFANLGFRSLLWAMSRGIFLVGISSEVQNVDGRRLLPSQFLVHDFTHGDSFVYFLGEHKSSFAKFWDRLELELDQRNVTEREKKLMDLVLFYFMHETYEFSLSCMKNYDFLTKNLDETHFRMSQDNDLAQMMSPMPSRQEIEDTVKSLQSLMKKMCPSVLKPFYISPRNSGAGSL